jgi:hypothetical protein
MDALHIGYTTMRLSNKTSTLLVCLLMLPGFYLAFTQSAVWFQYEAMGPLCFDASIFLMLGRAILNGFTPYVDLFENKPPGIFFISALSIYLTDTHLLGSYIEASTLILYPLMLGWLIWRFSKPQQMQWYRILLSGTAMVFGSALAVFGLAEAGQYEVESFGAFFGMLYIVSAVAPGYMHFWRICISGLFMLAAIGMKEPFFLTITGAMLVIYNDRLKELYARYFLPLMVTNVVGLSVLIATDLLVPYVKIYLFPNLPKMAGQAASYANKIPQGSIQAFVVNHFTIWSRIFENMTPYITLPVALVMLLACALVRPFWHRKRLAKQLLGVACVVVACVFSLYTVAIRNVVYNHQYIFLVPLYLGLGIAFLKDMGQARPDKRVLFVVLLFVFSSGVMFTNSGVANWGWMYNADKARFNTVKNIAATIDNVMDRCGQERYLNVAVMAWAGTPPALTKHTPYGPIGIPVGQYLRFKPLYRNGFLDSLAQTKLILTNNNSNYSVGQATETFTQVLETKFTTEPPDCAKDVDMKAFTGHNYLLYFHKDL